MIKTWKEREPSDYRLEYVDRLQGVMQAEIDELRTTLAERDATMKEFNQPVPLSAWQHMEAKLAAQRRVLEQSLVALLKIKRIEGDAWEFGSHKVVAGAITAIQGVLK